MGYEKQVMTRKSTRQLHQKVIPGGSDSILASLFYSVMSGVLKSNPDAGITNLAQWNHLMENYLNDKRNSIPDNIADRASARGNLRKELLKHTMSWKSFCRGLRFLNTTRFKLKVEVYHHNGEIHQYETPIINLGDPIFTDVDNQKGDVDEDTETVST